MGLVITLSIIGVEVYRIVEANKHVWLLNTLNKRHCIAYNSNASLH